MKILALILTAIIAIEFNLLWNGINHEPNWVKINNEPAIQEKREEIEGGWNWEIYSEQGNLITFLKFWVE